MKLVLLAWFLFMASASFWLPAYRGDLDGDALTFVPFYAFVAASAAIGVRRRAESIGDAVLSAVPAVALLAAAAVAGSLVNEQRADDRGEPIYLYFDVALWATWAPLVLSSALVSRTRWNGLVGIGVSLLIAALGSFLFTVRID